MSDKPSRRTLEDAASGLSSLNRLNRAMADIAEGQNRFKHIGETYSDFFKNYNRDSAALQAAMGLSRFENPFKDLKLYSPFSELQDGFKNLNSIVSKDIYKNSFADFYDSSKFKHIYESQNNLASQFAIGDFATRALANFDVPKLISDIQIKDILKHVSINRETLDNLRRLERTLNAGHELELAKQFEGEFYDSVDNVEYTATETLKNNPENIDSIIANAVDKITQQVISSIENKQPLEKRHKLDLAYKVICEIIISIIVSYALSFLPNPEEDRFKETVIERFNKIEQQFKIYHQELSDKIFYKVTRPVWISQEKSFTNYRIAYLVKGQEVQVLRFSGKWMYVTAYDLNDNSFKEGWVLKKYLVKVPNYETKPFQGLTDTWL